MRIFGMEIRRVPRDEKASATGWSHVGDRSRGGWWPFIREPFAGAWQRNLEWTADTVLAHNAVYACVTLIANDIGKLRPKLVQQNQTTGIWAETSSPAFSPVLRKPNRFQNHIQFKSWWATSKLIRGNAYALKERDSRKVVTALYLLDPSMVQVLVAPDGEVFYKLGRDNLSGLVDDVTVPATEIIHDRMNCLFHPLVGVSPIYAAGAAANIGLKIEENSTAFFGNGSNASGILMAPTEIDGDQAEELRDKWDKGYSGKNSGRVAVLGSGLKFQPLRMSAVDSQMIEHLKWTAETVCSVFHVPPFKLGIGQMPTYQNGETLNGIYYSDCLQSHIEQFELALDEGLGLTDAKDGKLYGVELDLDGLLRMDSATQIKTLAEGVRGAIYAPNEARRKVDLPPVPGGESPYLQHQDYSLAALAKRDAKDDPFGTTQPDPPEPTEPEDEDEDEDEDVRSLTMALRLKTAERRIRSATWQRAQTMEIAA